MGLNEAPITDQDIELLCALDPLTAARLQALAWRRIALQLHADLHALQDNPQ